MWTGSWHRPPRELAFDTCLPLPAVSSFDPLNTAGPMHYRDRQQQRKLRMPKGTVKWFNSTKGYGFIAPEDGGKDVFVHISAVERSGLTGLQDNQTVTYELQTGRDNRESAVNLSVE